jgi:hypothetical protein
MDTVLKVLMAIASLIPLIKELMSLVEKDMGAGTGPDKKAAVLTGIQAVIEDQSVWEKVKGVFGVLIDFLAKIHFGAKS